MRTLLNEAKDLKIFKRILDLFGEFVELYPGTGMSRVYKSILDAGMKSMPKDKRAIEMINFVVTNNVPKSVQDLQNTSFNDLPISLRPLYKSGNSKLVAFWGREGKLGNKVFDLLDLEGEGKGKWVDEKGEPVTLIDFAREAK